MLFQLPQIFLSLYSSIAATLSAMIYWNRCFLYEFIGIDVFFMNYCYYHRGRSGSWEILESHVMMFSV
ncbi:hypothetical protein VNO77_42397 [Canavalia gladiata]|uniref:Uncharacterized protein n=1 Tax=Canavalia gladiata TaxID=3824 RepID=A0AAN9JUZ2_CANGL